MISVLLPSRGRPGSLASSTRELLELASQPDDVQVLVAIDPDDDATAAAVLAPQVRLAVAPERYGYHGQQHYYSLLLATVSPDARWLMNWNDDARMLTAGWDEIIRSQEPAVLWPAANHAPHACTFPAWPRAWSDALGHVTPTPHVDTYLQRLGEALGLLVKIPVEVLHDRADVTGGHDDATYAEGRKPLGPEGMVPGFDAGVFHGQIAADAAVIRALSR